MSSPKHISNRSKASPARRAAYKCLEQIRKRDAFADDVIDKIIDHSNMDLRDRAFATKLVLGIISTKGVLDEVLNMCMRSPRDIRPDVRDALRITTYEIIYLQKDTYASVDQGVELVRAVSPKATGVANAVLRKLSKLAETFPFGNPENDIDAYSRLHGFPGWLTKKLIETLGAEAAHAYIVASNQPAPIFLSIIPIKHSRSEILDALSNITTELEEITINDISIDNCYKLAHAKAIASKEMLDLIDAGTIVVSDAAAQLVAQCAIEALAADVKENNKPTSSLSCLELCAGRGTKTILLQRNALSRIGTQIQRYIAVDNIEFKTKLLKRRMKEYDVKITESICSDILHLNFDDNERFDLVFLDSPCSGLGTLRRHPEIRWRITNDVIKEFAETDVDLLKQAASFVKPGAHLVYSTCTVTPEENALAIRSFLNSEAGSKFKLIPINENPALATYLIPNGCDAHFCAIMRLME